MLDKIKRNREVSSIWFHSLKFVTCEFFTFYGQLVLLSEFPFFIFTGLIGLKKKNKMTKLGSSLLRILIYLNVGKPFLSRVLSTSATKENLN